MEFDCLEYFDISPAISARLAVFPGDVPFKRNVNVEIKGENQYEASSIETTLHLGAHADAPSHYQKDAPSIDQRDLSLYMGKAQVIQLNISSGQRIYPQDLVDKKILAPRVLFCTNSFLDPDIWSEDFCSLSPELVELLYSQGVRLVGIDTPSIDPATSKKLESHKIVAQKNMAILEGLVLTRVPEGVYKLVALPLKIASGDASPVRAILIK